MVIPSISLIIIIILIVVPRVQLSTETEIANSIGKKMSLKWILKKYVDETVSIKDDARTKENVKIVTKVIGNEFITIMKEDLLFKEVYQNFYYTGSYYEGLKVGEANEFDLNIRLQMPFKSADIQIITDGIDEGYAMYKLSAPYDQLLANHPKLEIFRRFSRVFDESKTLLSQEKLNRWLQSVVDTAVHNSASIFEREHLTVKRSYSGPAMTLNIQRNDTKCSLDLVPVIQLKQFPESLPMTPFLENLPDTKKTCFLVPKPPRVQDQVKIIKREAPAEATQSVGSTMWNMVNALYTWVLGTKEQPVPLTPQPAPNLTTGQNKSCWFRVSIPDAEKWLMEKKGCVKMLVKIFKAIRDYENWTFFSSYYIKTEFMHALMENPDADFWKENELDQLFIMMLKKFTALETVPHIFFPDFNLIVHVRHDTLVNLQGHLRKILKWSQSGIQSDLERLNSYFTSQKPKKSQIDPIPNDTIYPIQSNMISTTGS